MKPIAKLKLAGVICSIYLLGACSAQEQPDRLEQEEVEQTIDTWLELWATYDLDLLDDIFWNSPLATYFSSEKEGLIRGYETFTSHHEGFGFVYGGKAAEKALWLEQVNITIHQSSAVIEAVWYFGDETAAKKTVQNGPVSFVMVRDQHGNARIAHTHFANYESWKTAGG